MHELETQGQRRDGPVPAGRVRARAPLALHGACELLREARAGRAGRDCGKAQMAGAVSQGEATLSLHIRALGLPAPEREYRFFERHASRIEKSLHCWLWTGARTGNGYGAVRVNGRQIGAHVAAFLAAYGELPDGHVVMHACDNPLCVRPDHLSSGTNGENLADRTRKGRAASGEQNGRAKLTESQVSEIRELLRAGIAKKAIARRFCVSDTLIRLIGKGANWSEKPRSQGEEMLCEQLRENGIDGWVREHRFAADRRWRFDVAWPAKLLAVEVEGGVWTNGRHTRGSGFVKDIAKYNRAAELGWRVLRFTTGQVKDGSAVQAIRGAL